MLFGTTCDILKPCFLLADEERKISAFAGKEAGTGPFSSGIVSDFLTKRSNFKKAGKERVTAKYLIGKAGGNRESCRSFQIFSNGETMSLQLIIGAAGSGKTTWLNRFVIQEAFNHPDGTYLLLVPEQFTMETQREIVRMHPNHGTMNIDVLSFVRLAYKIFTEMGCEDYVVLDDMGKCVILQKAAHKKAGDLKVFGRNLKHPGFISELKSMLSELYQYGISPDRLEQAQAEVSGHSLLSEKLRDMIAVYRAFIGELEERTITAEEILPVMCRLLPDSTLIQGAVIALDGFTGFTPLQYQAIALFLRYGARVMVTVTADPLADYRREAAVHELFHLSHHMVTRLLDLAKEEGVDCEKDVRILRSPDEWGYLKKRDSSFASVQTEDVVMSQNRFQKAPALAFLEKHVLRMDHVFYGGQPVREQWKQIEELPVKLQVFASPAEEAAAICARIYKFVMDRGYRYREIAVISGNMETYAPLLKEEMSRYGFPFFMDQKNSLLQNPLVCYIQSLFEVIQKDFSYESVFRLLKSGLAQIGREDRDYLENYVLARGIRGHKKWEVDWERQRRSGRYTDFDRLNTIRKQVCVPLLALREAWKEKGLTVRQQIEILVDFLREEKLEERMLKKSLELKEKGEFLASREYEQAYGLIMKLLDEIHMLMGEEVMSLQEFAACFNSGLEEIRVGSIPACTDRLLVGDMERTRLSGVRILFLAGVNEGQVPRNHTGGGIFTDYDKEQLLSCDIELSPTGRMNSFIDRFYLYLALTRASEGLWLSYVKADGSGKAMRPASCIREILSMYPGMSISDSSWIQEKEEDLLNPVAAWMYLVKGFARVDEAMKNPVWKQIYCYFYQKNPQQVEQLLQAAADGYEEESLTARLARRLYGQALQASVSRLEQQAACAFSHFLRYGLRLEERELFSFETTDMGTLFHSALEKYFRRVKEENLDITAVEEAKRKELVQDCVKDAARETGSDILDDSARNRWLAGKLTRITDRTVWALGEQLKEDGYETDGCEVVFEPDHTEAFSIPLTEQVQMLLQGRIDRIDVKQDEEQIYVRIVDYKSGSRTFDLVSVYYGLQIQLVFYMEAAQENFRKRNPDRKVRPGGVLYYNISDPIVDRTPDMDEAGVIRALLDKLQMNGMVTRASLEIQEEEELDRKKNSRIEVVDDPQFTLLQGHVHKMIRTLGQEIMEGRIAVNPYKRGQISACSWCGYKSICGFDQKRRGYGYRNLVSISKEEVWKRMKEEDDISSDTDQDVDRQSEEKRQKGQGGLTDGK